MRRPAAAAVASLSLIPAALAQPTPAELSAGWESHADTRQQHALIQVELTKADFEALANGEVLRRLVDSGHGLAAMGVAWIPCDALQVWVAIQDVGDRPLNQDQVEITRLADDTPARRLSYNLVHTPWPISDRQSVFTVVGNEPLWAASGQQVWERIVALEDPGLAPAPDPEAVWLGHLGGGFLISEIGGGSLVIMRFESDPGGSIPADLVARFSYLGLNRSMQTLASYALEVPEHFDTRHKPVALPDGRLVQPGSLSL